MDWSYNAKLVRVVDGDTVYLEVDLGFRLHITMDFRLLGIDTPEMVGASKTAALSAKAELERLLGLGVIRAYTEKSDKYGRWLVKLKVAQPDGSAIDVNQALLDGGFAVPYNP